MDLITSRLDLQFGSFPEPVIFLAGGQAVYSNEPGQQLVTKRNLSPGSAGCLGRASQRVDGDCPGAGHLSGDGLPL